MLDTQQKHLTLIEARTLCEMWQKILRLQDWVVEVKIARGNGMDLGPMYLGSVTSNTKRKVALIKLLDPSDWNSDTMVPQDMEVTLVHELLHLQCKGFDHLIKEDSLEDTGYEQMIILTSHALVYLRRAGAMS